MAQVSNGDQSDIPPVVFNNTLLDFWSEGLEGPCKDNICVIKPNSDLQYGNTVPLNKKYIIHSAQVATADDLAHMQLENTPFLLTMYAGPMTVIYIGCEGKTEDETLWREAIEANARKNYSVVNEAQRPKPIAFSNIDDLVRTYKGSKIHWAFAVDAAEGLPCINHPERVYKLNSKRWLADCELKSANDLIIDCEIRCPDHMTRQNLWYYGGPDCTFCENGLDSEVQRVRNILNTRPPFVLKLTQSLSSVGTLIAKDESERKEIVDWTGSYLRDYSPRITEDNAHMLTTSLILSDFILGATMALNFFVKRDGSVEFLGACHQQSTGESGRQATAITYADQPELRKKYQPTLNKIGRALHDEGYCGPVGADIMENPDDGTLFTIDLNVRSPLSFVLFLLRSHLNEKRGYAMSLVYECLMLNTPRERFEEKFGKELRESKIILMGSARLGKKEQWAYGIIVAGADQNELDALSDRILENEFKGKGSEEISEAAA